MGDDEMDSFEDYLARIENLDHRERTKEVLDWVGGSFPQLQPKIAWNQPMFTDHSTFIIGFSVSKTHLAAAPEREGILRFSRDIAHSGYDHSQQLFRIKWGQPGRLCLAPKDHRVQYRGKSGLQNLLAQISINAGLMYASGSCMA